MRLFTTTFLFSLLFSVQAKTDKQATLYSQLVDVNKEWLHIKGSNFQETVLFENDADRISTHLNLVIDYLKRNTSEDLNAIQRENRLTLLTKLQAYADSKIFPTNLYHQERTPYFIDYLGVHCAVGYMIQQSGRPDLALEIRNKENFAYVADIQTPGIEKWAKTNGFTLQELAWVQPAYMSQDPAQPIDGGTNGEVTDMAYDQINDKLYFIGDFTSVSGSSDFCGKVAYVQNDEITCISADLVGNPSSIFLAGSTLFLTGEFQNQGSTFNAAVYQGNGNWTYENVSDHAGTPTVRMFLDMNDPTINPEYAVDLTSHQEIWAHEIFPNNEFKKKISVYGEVHHLSHSGSEYIYAGEFDSCVVHSPQGDSTIYCNNILVQDLSGNYHSPSGDYPEIIYSVEPYNGQFLVSGQCNNDDSPTCISKMNPNTYNATTEIPYGYIETTIPGSLETAIIKSLHVSGPDEYYISGLFKAGFMTFGYNLALVVELPNQDRGVVGKGSTNRIINDFHVGNGTTIIGGDFNADAFRSDLDHLAKTSGTNDLKEENISDFAIVPNPSSGHFKLHFEAPQNGTIKVFALNGQLLEELDLKHQMAMEMNLSNLNPGLYLLSVESATGVIAKRIKIK